MAFRGYKGITVEVMLLFLAHLASAVMLVLSIDLAGSLVMATLIDPDQVLVAALIAASLSCLLIYSNGLFFILSVLLLFSWYILLVVSRVVLLAGFRGNHL